MLKYTYEPFWRSEAAAAKPTISFLSNFPPCGGGVWGEPQIKMMGNFWVLPRASKARAGEAQASFVKILRILPEIHSNFVQYTLPKSEFRIESQNRVAPQARHKKLITIYDKIIKATIVSFGKNK